PEAIKALRACTADGDMDFRELVVKTLAESLKQPIDAQWLVPVILARKAVGDAGRLMRLYAGPKAVPALLSCLDPNDPSVRGYYNQSIVYSQGSCQGGLRIPWISDLNRDGKPAEIEQNRKTLKILRAWVEHYYKHRLNEKPKPPYRSHQEDDKTWGDPADGISIRIRVNQRVWPEGMPQIVLIDVRGHPGEGSVHLSKLPEPLEAEVNGHWYARHPPPKGPSVGISAGHGTSFQIVRLGGEWRRLSDGQPLQLAPGKYTIRVRLSTAPKDRRTALAVSKPIHFEIIPTLSPPTEAVGASSTQSAALPGRDLPDLDATAKLLEKAVGGKWQKDLHSGLHISRRILRGEVRSGAGKLLVRYHVFPFGCDDESWPHWQRWLQRSYAQVKGARVLGASARCSVVELASDTAAAARYGQAVKKALGLSLREAAPPAGRSK
ncbi:MAG: hypothetical protein WBF17_06995, partial [Phycisphaerae bacterium]